MSDPILVDEEIMYDAEQQEQQKEDEVPTVEHMEISKESDDDEEDKDKENPANDDSKDDDDSMTLVNDDDDDGSITKDDKEDDILTTEQVEERLMQATTWKEQGNAAFQKGDLDPAARAYRKGVALLKPVQKRMQFLDAKKNNTEQEQYKALAIALQTNLSMVCYKQQKYANALKIASQALSLDPNNVKALYRRALAHRALGDWEDARADLKQALQQDPNNTACKKELVSLKQQMDGFKASQKKALAKAFAKSSSSFLYDDKEADELRKEQEKQKQLEIEQELLKKRKAQWEDECVHRMAKNEPAISFDDWEKEQKELEDARKKEDEKKRKEEEKKRREERKQADAQRQKDNSKDDSDDDEDALTEEELKMMRGYKKTKDGRTTSYFTRELSAEEKQNLGDMAPKRLDETPQRLPVASAAATNSTTAAAASKWNQAGTWEEKDTTAWCKETLEQRLKETTVADDQLEVSISKVDELTGDASVAITGGKKRYIFDFHVKLKYEMKEAGTEDVVAKGTVALPDICSGNHEEIEINFSARSKKPSSAWAAAAQDMQQRLAQQLRANIQAWVEEFNAQY